MVIMRQINREESELKAPEEGYENLYLAFSDESNLFLYLQLQVVREEDCVACHALWKQFTPHIARIARIAFRDLIRPFILGLGVHKFVGIVEEDKPGWAHLMHVLGFEPKFIAGHQAIVEDC